MKLSSNFNFIFLGSCKVTGIYDAATNNECNCADGKYFADTGDTCNTCENARCATCSGAGDTCGRYI